MNELIELYEEYLAFLNMANQAPTQMAYIHGWRCSEEVIKKGAEYRKRIAELRNRNSGMRTCAAGVSVKRDGKWERLTIVGFFHQFASKFEEFEYGLGNYTVAIVEDKDGQVWECDTGTLKFTREE